MIIKVNDKKQQIIHNYYCHDSYAESCDFDCGNCKDLIKKDIDELERLIRADAIDELLKILSPCYDCNACEEESKNYFQNSCMSEMLDYEEIVERAKQLKEKK